MNAFQEEKVWFSGCLVSNTLWSVDCSIWCIVFGHNYFGLKQDTPLVFLSRYYLKVADIPQKTNKNKKKNIRNIKKKNKKEKGKKKKKTNEKNRAKNNEKRTILS